VQARHQLAHSIDLRHDPLALLRRKPQTPRKLEMRTQFRARGSRDTYEMEILGQMLSRISFGEICRNGRRSSADLLRQSVSL
jgi:hypothetical protein